MGTRFSAPSQTGSGDHPASYTIGTGSFPGVKPSGRGVEHPPPSSAEVEGSVELYYIYSPSGPSWPVLERNLPLLYFSIHLEPSSMRADRHDESNSRFSQFCEST